MPIATHTLTGDLLPVLGGVEWDSVTAWLEVSRSPTSCRTRAQAR